MIKAVSSDWVLNQLAGMRFPEQGAAYGYMKRCLEAQPADESIDPRDEHIAAVTLTDQQMIALVASSPIDNYASGGNGVKPGHVTPFESSAAADVRDRYERHGIEPSQTDLAFIRSVFIRVFGASAALTSDERMRMVRALMNVGDVNGRHLAAAVEARCADLARVRSALEYSGPSPLLPVGERVEALVAEVKALRAKCATATPTP